jgi:hypothetical protein
VAPMLHPSTAHLQHGANGGRLVWFLQLGHPAWVCLLGAQLCNPTATVLWYTNAGSASCTTDMYSPLSSSPTPQPPCSSCRWLGSWPTRCWQTPRQRMLTTLQSVCISWITLVAMLLHRGLTQWKAWPATAAVHWCSSWVFFVCHRGAHELGALP